MNHWHVITLIAFLIALGLVLRYNTSTNNILKDFFSGTNTWFSTLSLQKFSGN